MYVYPQQAVTEATHTDENGYMYKMLTPSYVLYWDRRFNGWFEEKSKTFDFLVEI